MSSGAAKKNTKEKRLITFFIFLFLNKLLFMAFENHFRNVNCFLYGRSTSFLDTNLKVKQKTKKKNDDVNKSRQKGQKLYEFF